ncbi:MAG: hypothetical protein M5R40_26810 [Anaerolineae bacterium]|nr:hypothetical protein [Anaerolineae bacterium]
MGDELHDQSRKVNTEGGPYFENLTIVYRQDAAPVERYLRTILESPNRPWCDYRNLKARYIDLRGDAVYQRRHEFDFPLVPTALSWLAAQGNAEPEPVESIMDAIKQHERIALLGDPGAGKSTTLQVLLVDAAEACLKDPINNPLPVYLRLGAWPEKSGDTARLGRTLLPRSCYPRRTTSAERVATSRWPQRDGSTRPCGACEVHWRVSRGV